MSEMDADCRAERLEQFEAACRAQGLALTVQRRVIFDAVIDREDHPTADQVYDLVKDRIPGVSRTTVYRALDTLVQIGTIIKVCHPGASARYDPKVDQHHHLVCTMCNSIIDLNDERLNAIRLPEIDTGGFDVREFHIHLRGTCPDCLRKRNPT